MKRTVFATLAVAALVIAMSTSASATRGGQRVIDRPLTAYGIDSGPYDPTTGSFDKYGPIVTIIDGRLETGENHVVSSGGPFVGTITYPNRDSWSDTPTGTPSDDMHCPEDFPYPFKTTAAIIGGTGRFKGATGSLLIEACNKVTGSVLTTIFTITGTIRY